MTVAVCHPGCTREGPEVLPQVPRDGRRRRRSRSPARSRCSARPPAPLTKATTPIGQLELTINAPAARSLVYDRNGNVMATFATEDRSPVKLKDIPQVLINAVISIEDRKFYEHHGVDWAGTGARPVQERRRGRGHPGRFDDHPAAGEEHVQHQPQARPDDQGARGDPRGRAREADHEERRSSRTT